MTTLVRATVALAAILSVAPAMLPCTSAAAADLPRRRVPAYVPPEPVPVFTWTGIYGGINGGYGFGDFTGRGNAQAGSPNGGLVGGTLGYNYQFRNVVVGVEADADYASINNTQTTAGPLTSKGSLNFQDTIRGRVGVAVDRMLFFATGGYAGGTVHSTVYDVPNNFFSANSNYLNGYAVGGGIEYAIMPHLSGKVEYLYTDLGPAYNFVGSPDVTRVGLNTSNIRAGINCHF